MDTHLQTHRDHSFVLGLLTGAFVGAGLTFWLAPRLATEITERVGESVRDLGERASEQFEHASARVGEVVSEMTRQGLDVRDNVAEVVERGAQVVERFASAAKKGRS